MTEGEKWRKAIAELMGSPEIATPSLLRVLKDLPEDVRDKAIRSGEIGGREAIARTIIDEAKKHGVYFVF